MAFFQNSVVQKYLAALDRKVIDISYSKFKEYFHDPQRQQNIRDAKEEQFQEGFLRELFVNILGYTLYPEPVYNLTTEYKNVKDSKKADGAIIIEGAVKGVIELKGTDTTDLNKIENQAFGYKNNQPECVYVITSNFEKIRFYIDNAIDHLEFNLFTLSSTEFELLWMCLAYVNIKQNIPKRIKDESVSQEDEITKILYKDYSLFKRELHQNLVRLNPQYDALTLFKKSQKLLDRFLFLFFAEDRLLLPPNSVRLVLNDWRDLQERDVEIPLYDRFKKYFEYLNTGYKGKRYDVYAYNGGLFKPDKILDTVNIDGELLYEHTKNLSEYDFVSEVDVNILGHIFENSLNELDEITAQLEGLEIDKSKTKRKKDGVFYTPKFITKYIVENTLGKLCTEKKTELQIKDEDYTADKRRQIKTKQTLIEKLTEYRTWLLHLTVCDPACGSGAFLNQTLDFLINEHRYIDELQAKLFGDALVLSDFNKSILENNLFGVDLNEESVEIAKLSLWLRTAQPNRKLNDLSNNIKCGNSLIDDPTIAGDKAFNWHEAFPQVFEKGGFDVVIGNPPYGAYLDSLSKKYFQNKSQIFQGNFEIYFFFIELVCSIIKRQGRMGFITPDTWISIPQAKKLREHILNNYGINSIVVFNHSVFPDASVNSIIFVLSFMDINTECEVSTLDPLAQNGGFFSGKTKNIKIESWKYSDDKQFHVSQNEDDIAIIEKIKAISFKGEKFLDVCQGIVPYSTENLTKDDVRNRIYHSKIKENDNFGIWIQGRSINRYSIFFDDIEYLNYGKWLHRPRKSKYFTNERILVQEITGGHPPRISAVIFNGVLYHDPGIISCLNISGLDTRYILVLLNSRLLSWFNLKTSPKGNRVTFPKVLIGDIRKLPIVEIGGFEQKPFIESAKIMLSLSNKLSEVSLQFQRTLKRRFDLQNLTNRLLDWYFLSFGEFIIELGRKKVKFSLADEAEWEGFFVQESTKALELKAKIDYTDREIDQMVYELYGLTEDEIKIMENS